MLEVDKCNDIQCHIFVSGMHLLSKYGATYCDILADGYKNVYIPEALSIVDRMDINLANTIHCFSDYIRHVKPYMIVVHGDRIDALAGAIVAMLNNIPLGHIEGGEITGTADEAMRHAISKMANVHFVANGESRLRLIQLGEREDSIHVIGSPDIDIMLGGDLPDIKMVRCEYGIPFDNYALLMYHPVNSEVDKLPSHVKALEKAVVKSGRNFIAIYPNNDHGCDIIISALKRLEKNPQFKVFKSLPFEVFLTVLKNCDFMIGNSSAGIREACVYGIPVIDLGTRQHRRYSPHILQNIMHANEDMHAIMSCIERVDGYKRVSSYFGDGKSSIRFVEILTVPQLWHGITQKCFVDSDITQRGILSYINEVCF